MTDGQQDRREQSLTTGDRHGSDEPPAGASLGIASAPNLRDLGGWATRDGGRVRRGLVYRSAQLTRLVGADSLAFAQLGIRTVYDLRTSLERGMMADRLPDGTDYMVADVLAGSSAAAPAQLLAVLSNPTSANAMLGGDKTLALFTQAYREIVSLPSALDGFGRLFRDLGDEQRRPVLFHCATGKDRTGWAAAALLMLLGVPHDDVMNEYMLTNAALLPSLEPVFDQFRQAGGDPDLLRPVLGVEPAYLETALDEMRLRFGSVEGYFDVGLQLGPDAQQALRDALIDPDASQGEADGGRR
jgi:protein-tyrosine phosphatase